MRCSPDLKCTHPHQTDLSLLFHITILTINPINNNATPLHIVSPLRMHPHPITTNTIDQLYTITNMTNITLLTIQKNYPILINILITFPLTMAITLIVLALIISIVVKSTVINHHSTPQKTVNTIAGHSIALSVKIINKLLSLHIVIDPLSNLHYLLVQSVKNYRN